MEPEKDIIEEEFLLDEENKNDEINNKCLKYTFVSICIFVIIGAIIAASNLIYTHKNDKISKNIPELIRLKNWEFGSEEKINLTGEKISLGVKSDNFFKAPEDFYVCTAMGGLSGHTDKYFYEKKLEEVDKNQFNSDWWFRSSFSLNKKDIQNSLILLHINGINYKSDIYLDGKLIETQKNIIGTFVKYTLDITSSIKDENNVHYIAFKIKRPYNQWLGEKNLTNHTDLATTFVDWNPEAPDSNMGIWQPIDIQIIPKNISIISSAFINTKLINDKYSNLEIYFYINNWENKTIYNNISIQLGDFINFTLHNITLKSKEEKQISLNSKDYQQLEIDNSKLWWPYQMGEPKLHNFTIKIMSKGNFYVYKREIGLRQVNSELDEHENRRVYKINNKKILLKGAGWSPDIFLRQSPENYYDHINYVRDMELNVIRLEGNSEGEEFYDYCDKLGILVISGWCCCDSWQRWDDWSLEDEKVGNKSVITQIRKLSPHPSVIIFILGSDMSPTNGIEEKWREIFQKENWPNEIISSAHVDSREGYKTGVKMTGPYSWVPPNYFYLEESRTIHNGGAWGFLTEGGPGENPLRKGSFEKIFNDENRYNYTSESWKYHCGKQGGSFADLDKFILPLNERYGKILDFDDFQKKSMAAVYEGHRAMFEAYICYKYNSTGVIQWMLNNAWPSNIWHLYDYFFAPTPAYFATKKAGERIHVLYNYEDSYIYLLNNYFDNFKNNFFLSVYIISVLDGNEILYNNSYTFSSIKGDEIIKVHKLKNDYENTFIIHFEYSFDYNGESYSYTNTYWLNKEMDQMDFDDKTFYNVAITNYTNFTLLQNLPQTNLDIEIIEKQNFKEGNKIKNKYLFKISNIGESIALLLEMKLYEIKENKDNEIITPIFWSDNYFSLRNGTSTNISVEYFNNNSSDILLEIIGWNSEFTKILINE